MLKILIYILGVFLFSFGIFLTILDINVLSSGYSLLEFGKFIISRSGMYFIIGGLLCIFISIERRVKYELLLRHHSKLERK